MGEWHQLYTSIYGAVFIRQCERTIVVSEQCLNLIPKSLLFLSCLGLCDFRLFDCISSHDELNEVYVGIF